VQRSRVSRFARYRLPDEPDTLTSYVYYQQAAHFCLQLLDSNLCTPRCALTSTAHALV
jgi:hypothetical protein